MLCDKLLYGLDWASSSEIEDIRKTVEDKLKIRLLSTIDAVNTCKGNKLVCRYHRADRRKECLECFYHAMMEKYFKKKLELELLYGDYKFKH